MRAWRSLGCALALGLAGCGSVTRADELYDSGQYLQAIDAYKEVYEDHRDDPRVNQRIGNAFFFQRRYDKAEKFFRRAHEAGATDPEVLWRLGECQDRQKMYADAAKTFSRILDREPGNVAAMNNLAVMQIHLGEQAEAQRNLDKALSLDARDKEALFNLALLFEQHHHDPDRAAELFRRYREAAPDDDRAADVREWLRRYESAQSAATPARGAPVEGDRAPKSDEPATGTTAGSEASIDSSMAPVEAAPDPTIGILDSAEPDARPLSAAPPASPDAPLSADNLAALLATGDTEAVIRRFEAEVQKRDPDYGRYCLIAGSAWLERKDAKAALPLLREAVKRLPDEPDAYLQLGWAQHYLGASLDARRTWEDAYRRFPERREGFDQAMSVLP